MPIRLLVANDCNTCLLGMTELLRTAPEFALVGTTRDGGAAVHLAASLNPDILLLEVELRTLDGLTVAARVRAATPSVRCVFYTRHTGERWQALATSLGVSDWIHKSVESDELLQRLHDVFAGRRAQSRAAARLEGHHGTPLSRREIAVLRHFVRGLNSKEIGPLIGCKHRTVDKHIESIRTKFGVPRSRAIIPIGLAHLAYLDSLAEDDRGAP